MLRRLARDLGSRAWGRRQRLGFPGRYEGGGWVFLGSGRREGPTCEVGRGCQWAPPSFPRIPGRGLGWGLAFADACLSSLSSLPTPSPVSLPSLYLSLDCCSGCHPAHLCLLCYLGLLPPPLALIPLPLGVSLSELPQTGIPFLFPVLMAHSGSLLCLSLILASHLGLTLLSTSLSVSACHLGCWPLALPSRIHLCTGSCPSVSLPNHLGPLPAHLSSSVPSSPLSPSPSAVSPTGSACCSRCSCTAAWGRWPGATSPR